MGILCFSTETRWTLIKYKEFIDIFQQKQQQLQQPMTHTISERKPEGTVSLTNIYPLEQFDSKKEKFSCYL